MRKYNFSSMKIIIDILISDVDPILYNNNSGNSMRHFWTSYENVTILMLI